jgi:hypothetical protein
MADPSTPVFSSQSPGWDCTCGAPEDAEPEDHDLDCPEYPTGEDPDRDDPGRDDEE